MVKYQLQDKSEVAAVITTALAELGRTDSPFSYGAVNDPEGDGQIVYFDLPRISPLQFNISTSRIKTRRQLIARIKRAIEERLAIDWGG